MSESINVTNTTGASDVMRIGQALRELIESLDIEVLIENGETPRGYLIDPRKGILRGDGAGNAATHDAVLQLGVTLLGRMLFKRGGIALMQRVRDQVVAQYVAETEQYRTGDGELIDGNEHRRWLTHLFKVCWKGIEVNASK